MFFDDNIFEFTSNFDYLEVITFENLVLYKYVYFINMHFYRKSVYFDHVRVNQKKQAKTLTKSFLLYPKCYCLDQ